MSVSFRWRKENEEGVMSDKTVSVWRREDGSIDHDHCRREASQLRAQAMHDLFQGAVSGFLLRPLSVLMAVRREQPDQAA
jgi:hypothetical protein